VTLSNAPSVSSRVRICSTSCRTPGSAALIGIEEAHDQVDERLCVSRVGAGDRRDGSEHDLPNALVVGAGRRFEATGLGMLAVEANVSGSRLERRTHVARALRFSAGSGFPGV
jgi:hypothetical protein